MKPLKLLSLSILIASALLLSGAKSECAQSANHLLAARNKEQRQPDREIERATTPIIPPVAESRLRTEPKTEPTDQQPEHWYDRFWPPLFETFLPPIWSNWGLIIVGLVAALVALGTLRVIARQTKDALYGIRANRRAADAAKKSADTAERALNDLERPWIFIRITSFEGFDKPPTEFDPTMIVNLKWEIENSGRTPAFAFDGAVSLHVFTLPLPDFPDYGKAAPIALVPIPQGRPQPNNTGWFIDKDEYEGIYKDLRQLVFYGFIKYRDTFRREHVSRWCAILKIQKLRIGGVTPITFWSYEGPPNWTEYT